MTPPKIFLWCLLAASIVVAKANAEPQTNFANTTSANTNTPNVLFMLSDDVGWSDLSTHPGGTIHTPHIDKLFKDGVELKNYMGWCVCSPTRAMLMTGRHPFRVGTGPETGGELSKDETTIAEGFKANGYRTGIFGKWHNGDDPATPEFVAAMQEAFKDRASKKEYKGGLGVNAHGFDEAWVYYGGGFDYFTRRVSGGKGPVSWWHNLEYRPNDVGYTEDFIVQHAMDFIRDNKDRPFFCYIPFHIVHAPLQAKPSDLALADADMDANLKANDADKRTYKAMMIAMDNNVGAILAELKQLGLSSNTIVVFSSDNGATKDGCNLPFRGGKHTLYEGGTHLPTVFYWPAGGIVHGSWDGLCGALDMFPTLIDMAGLKMPQTRSLDGKNIWPALRDKTASPVDNYYWSWHAEDAIRTADWRMHRYSDHNELYDMHSDISETKDVAAAHPDVVKDLTAKMNAWDQSMGAAISHLPVPAKLDAKPAPEGDVLKVTATVTDKVKPKDHLVLQFAGFDEPVYATDYLEYDVMVPPGSLKDGFYYSPFKTKDGKHPALAFSSGIGFDQFGREQASGPATKGGPGVWEHRVIGASSLAPESMGKQGIVFSGNQPGTYTLYLDNLRVRHADGTTTPIWTSKKDIRTDKGLKSDQFKDISVSAVPLSEAGK
jgi:arylsulfatase A-like enzyme